VRTREAACCIGGPAGGGDPFIFTQHNSNVTNWQGGLVVGAGGEFLVANSIIFGLDFIFGVEYTHLFLDRKTALDNNLNCQPTTCGAPAFAQTDTKGDIDRVLFRGTYKFGWGAPIVAKY
jgi:hypothetical protein